MRIRSREQFYVSLITVCAGLMIGFGPIAAVALIGFDVPTAALTTFTGPAPPMIQGSTWAQTFYFPDRIISAIALRPGTYGRKRNEGQVTGEIGPIIANKTQVLETRTFTINLNNLHDNKWHTFRFKPLHLEPGTRCSFQLKGIDLPSDPSITFWLNNLNHFHDGIFTINGAEQPGDLCFKILCRVRYLDAFRMLKTRWTSSRTGIWATTLLPLTLVIIWPPICIVGLWFLVKPSQDDRQRNLSK